MRAENGRRCTGTEGPVCLALLLIAATSPAFADDAPYAEYRYVRALGQIQISTGVFDRTSTLDSRKAALEHDGILIVETDTPRTFTRTEHVGAHLVVTAISLHPPSAMGKAARRLSRILRCCWMASRSSTARSPVDGAASIGSSSIPRAGSSPWPATRASFVTRDSNREGSWTKTGSSSARKDGERADTKIGFRGSRVQGSGFRTPSTGTRNPGTRSIPYSNNIASSAFCACRRFSA